MSKISRILIPIVVMVASLSACSESYTDWVEKMKLSDRKSTISGMLNELNSIENQINLMSAFIANDSEASDKLTMGKVDQLLELDRRPPSPEYNPAYLESFNAISEAKNKVLEEIQNYRDLKREKLNASTTEEEKIKAKKTPEPSSLITARANALSAYKQQSSKLVTFLKDKLYSYRQAYAGELIRVIEEGKTTSESCKHREIIDALRTIGDSLHTEDAKKFMESSLYRKLTQVFVDAAKRDIAHPPSTALIVVNTFKKWNAVDQLDIFLDLYKRDRIDFELRNALVKSLTKFALGESSEKLKGKLLPVFKELLMTPLDEQPAYYLGQGVKVIAHYKASDDAVIERAIECLWLEDALRRNANSECRLALNTFDPKRVATAALKAFKRQNKKVEERAYRYNYAHVGHIESKSAELLGDVKAKSAARELLMSLKNDPPNPEFFTKEPHKTEFLKGQIQRTISISRTLAAIGESGVVKPLMALLTDKDRVAEYKIAARQQITFLGSRSALKGLLKLFNKKLKQEDFAERKEKVEYAKVIAILMDSSNRRNFGSFKKSVAKDLSNVEKWNKDLIQGDKKTTDEKIAELEKITKDLKAKVKAQEGKGVKLPKSPEYQKPAPDASRRARIKAQKANKKLYDEYMASLDDTQKKFRELKIEYQKQRRELKVHQNNLMRFKLYLNLYKLWIKDYTMIMSQLKVAEGTKSASAWSNKLNDSDKDIRALAAYHVAHQKTLSGEVVEKLITRVTQETELAVIEVVLFGLVRHVQAAQLKEIEAAFAKLKTLSQSTTPGFDGISYNLQVLIAKLKRDA